ncbi:flavodoxin [Clostridium sp. UBA4548]|uniref:flavodoxin n=1 Tax=Clostridium sp. UBA4548 TaxID=1946361 RepID=UPI0025B8AEE8|nr:flavodoxin [Clostridium sp. UBA4548]
MSKVTIIYWSGTGNTKTMAEFIEAGAKSKGSEVVLKEVGEATIQDIEQGDVVALGCPSMGDEILEESEMEPFIEEIKNYVKNKKIVLFGSYGWGDGQWMRDWEERMLSYGAVIQLDCIIANYEPDEDKKEECVELGKKIAQ